MSNNPIFSADGQIHAEWGAKYNKPESLRSTTAGVKYDADKPRYDLLPVNAVAEIVKVFTVGAKKYADRNWQKGIKYSRLLAAQARHKAAYERGENIDAETGCHHQAMVAWYSIVLLEFDKFLPQMDDRQEALKYGPEFTSSPTTSDAAVNRPVMNRLPGTDMRDLPPVIDNRHKPETRAARPKNDGYDVRLPTTIG